MLTQHIVMELISFYTHKNDKNDRSYGGNIKTSATTITAPKSIETQSIQSRLYWLFVISGEEKMFTFSQWNAISVAKHVDINADRNECGRKMPKRILICRHVSRLAPRTVRPCAFTKMRRKRGEEATDKTHVCAAYINIVHAHIHLKLAVIDSCVLRKDIVRAEYKRILLISLILDSRCDTKFCAFLAEIRSLCTLFTWKVNPFNRSRSHTVAEISEQDKQLHIP